MAFRLPPAILQKVLRFSAIKHEGGKFFLWEIPCFISELYTFVYLQRLLEDKLGQKGAHSILYNMGFLQAIKGIKMITERFGYAKSISDKDKLLEFNSGQGELVGTGRIKLVRKDYKKSIFISRISSPIAEEYKKFFGIQKNSIDCFLRGLAAGAFEGIIGKKMFSVETQCLATGKSYCEFVTKPMKSWSKEDCLFRIQSINEEKNMKELGAKIEPYIMSKEAFRF